MTPDEAQKILDEEGVDGLICKSYPLDKIKRIALLRISHACENVSRELEWCTDLLARFLTNPTEYLADELVVEAALALADRLHVLEGELFKSIPEVSKRGAARGQGRNTGLRVDGQTADGEAGQGTDDPPDQDPGDWGDVPF